MGKETLSVKQANNIINKANDIYGNSNTRMNDLFDQFLTDISKVWADNNAVKLAETVNDSYQEIMSNLTTNNRIFANTITEIANSYKGVGGNQESITAIALGFGGQLNLEQVKECFSNSTNADDFGFLDIKTSPEVVMNSLKTLENDVNKASVEIVNEIKGIPAFGNTQVQLEIAKSAGKVVQIIEEELKHVTKSTKEEIENTARAYGAVGTAAIEAIGGLGNFKEMKNNID